MVRFGRCLLILSLIFLTGCFDSRETDATGYVIAVGLDKGEKDNIRLTVAIADPRFIAGITDNGGGKDGGNDMVIKSVEAYGPLSGIEQLKAAASRHLSLQHTKAFIFSEELAKSGLGEYINELAKDYEVRGTSNVYVCRGQAKDFLENNRAALEVIPGKQYELSGRISKEHGFYRNEKFRDFYVGIKNTATDPVMPVIAIHEEGFATAKPGVDHGGEPELGKYIAGDIPIESKNKTQIGGMAVFRQDKMVGMIDGEKTRYFLMLKGQFNRGFFNIPDPLAEQQSLVGLVVRQDRSPRYRVGINEDGHPVVDVELFLKAELVSVSDLRAYEKEENRRLLEEALSTEIQTGCTKLIKYIQEECAADICGFGERMKGKFLYQQDWLAFNWLEKYPQAMTQVKVNITTLK
jgi:spore germination protein KC